MTDNHAFLFSLFQAAINAALPERIIAGHLPKPPKGRTIVIGAGKGSAAMARALEQNWSARLEGLVVTRYGHSVKCDHIEIVEAAHPVPDEAGMRAARRILDLVSNLTEDDLVIALISGGGSALLALPGSGLSLRDKQAVGSALLASGATITEMNCVRKHLSGIKGGKLARAAKPARVHGLLISDIPGDDPAMIASGPTVADATTLGEARAIVEKYRLDLPHTVLDHLKKSSNETPKPGESSFDNVENIVIATARNALNKAAELARSSGYQTYIIADDIEGEARDVGHDHAKLARDIAFGHHKLKPPIVILSGGETSVTLKGKGRGGRNGEFLLSTALTLDDTPHIWALAGDTDGIDGSEDNAGARIGPDTLKRAGAIGLDASGLLENNDAYSFFEALGDLVMTGPTLTNVNDFRAILIDKASS